MSLHTFFACGAAAIMLLAPLMAVGAEQPPAGAMDPKQVVEELMAGRDRPFFTDRQQALLKDFRRSPQRYAAAVQAQLALPANADLGKYTNGPQGRFSRALHLAVELGREHGEPLVHMALGAIDDRLASVRRQMADKGTGAAPEGVPPPSEVLWTLDGFRLGVLDIAERINDPFAVPYVLNCLTELNRSDDPRNSATRFVMLRYLATVASGNAVALSRLKSLLEAPGSQLARDPQARRTLDAMRRGARPSTAPAQPGM